MEKETMQMDPCNVLNRSFWKLFFRNKIQKLNHFRISLVLQGRVTETLTVIESHLATDSDLSSAIIQLFMR